MRRFNFFKAKRSLSLLMVATLALSNLFSAAPALANHGGVYYCNPPANASGNWSTSETNSAGSYPYAGPVKTSPAAQVGHPDTSGQSDSEWCEENQPITTKSITVQKNIDTDGDGDSDRVATAGEWTFTLDGTTSQQTNSSGQVIFASVSSTSSHSITESGGPNDQSFSEGSGTNCSFTGSTANVGIGTSDATCVFLNEVQQAQTRDITVQKLVDTDADGDSDRVATAGEWTFTLDGTTSLETDSNGQVAFNDVSTDQHTITESDGPLTQDFAEGSGTHCSFTGSTATVSANGANVTCTFLNEVTAVQTRAITIHKGIDTGVDGEQDRDAHSNEWTFTLDGTTSEQTDNDGDVVFDDVSVAAHTVTESDGPEDQAFAEGGGDEDCSFDENGNLTVAAGTEDVSCTFINREEDSSPDKVNICHYNEEPQGNQDIYSAEWVDDADFNGVEDDGGPNDHDGHPNDFDYGGPTKDNGQPDEDGDQWCKNEAPLNSLSGTSYQDLNLNGVLDSGEPGIAGVTMNLTGETANGDPVNLFTETDADGNYIFDDLPSGTFNVTEVQPVGYLDGQDTVGSEGGTQTGTDTISGVFLDPVDATGYNFGNIALALGGGSLPPDVLGARTAVGGGTLPGAGPDSDLALWLALVLAVCAYAFSVYQQKRRPALASLYLHHFTKFFKL